MERPEIKPKLSAFDKLIEALGYSAVVAIWALALVHYGKLPAMVPIHYNAAGQVDRLSDRSSVLVLPLLATVIFGALTMLSSAPNIFNYPVAITKENAARQYANASRLIRFLKLGIVVIFGLITFRTVQIALKQATGLGAWFIPVALGVLFIPILVFIVKAVKMK